MTDRENEKMKVEPVNGGVVNGHVMHVLNTKIAVAEQMVESLYEARRELINRFNLFILSGIGDECACTSSYRWLPVVSLLG